MTVRGCAAVLTCLMLTATTWAQDADADGFTAPLDCNDLDASINPSATEIANGFDDNCNGQLDEGFTPCVAGSASTPEFWHTEARIRRSDFFDYTDMVWTGDRALAIWSNDQGTALVSVQLDRFGRTLARPEIVHPEPSSAPKAAWTGDRVGVVERNNFLTLDAAGRPLGPAFALDLDFVNDLVWTADRFGACGAYEGVGDTESQVYCQLLDADGTALTTVTRISLDSTRGHNDLVMAASADRIAVGYSAIQTFPPREDLELVVLHRSNGQVAGRTTLVVDDGIEIDAIAWNGDTFGVIYTQGASRFYREIDVAGQPVTAALPLGSEPVLGATWAGDRYLIDAWVANGAPIEPAYYTIDRNATILDPIVSVAPNSFNNFNDVEAVFTGSSYLFAWPVQSSCVSPPSCLPEGCCPWDLHAASVGCACGNDTDADGWFDCVDCAINDDGIWSPPLEVYEIEVEKNGTDMDVSWGFHRYHTGNATNYDVIRVAEASLRAAGDFSSATCSSNDETDGAWSEPLSTTPAGAADLYLVSAHNACGTGTFGNATISPDPRDGLDSSPPCP